MIIAVAAALTISGTLAAVAIGAAASASGVRPKPTSAAAWSLVTSSCASRLVTSAAPVSSFRIRLIFLPATVSPCCLMYSSAPARSCLPVEADGPVIGTIMPIFTVSSARAGAVKTEAANAAPSNRRFTIIRRLPPGCRRVLRRRSSSRDAICFESGGKGASPLQLWFNAERILSARRR